MEKNDFIYLLWGDGGLCGIISDNKDEIYKIVSKVWHKSIGVINYTPNDIETLITNGIVKFNDDNVWYLEKHPLNALYEDGTNIKCF